MGQSFTKHEGASSTSHREATSLQDMYPMDTYYTRFMVVHQRYISLLSGKEDIHSMDKMTIMSTDYARLSLKTQNQLRSAVANLPSDIQSRIFRSKAMTESCDQWFRHFKIMVTSHFPVPGEEADPKATASILAIWNQCVGSSHRVYEKQHPFPGLIVNYEDGAEDV